MSATVGSGLGPAVAGRQRAVLRPLSTAARLEELPEALGWLRVHRAGDAAVSARQSAWVEALLERLPVLPIDLASGARVEQLHRLRARLDL